MITVAEHIQPSKDGTPGSSRRARVRPTSVLRVLTFVGLMAGLALYALGKGQASNWLLALTTIAGLVPLAVAVERRLFRREIGVDLIALLAMSAALAFGEFLAGSVIAVMLASGGALEDYASSTARRELTLLVQRAPREVRRYDGSRLETRNVGEVRPGDRLLVKSGEVVPVDGVVVGSAAVLDESSLTGESGPVERSQSEQVRSGTVNAGGSFDLLANSTAEDSTYSGVVRLVAEAQANKSPFVRLADRYALYFLPLTLSIAAGSWLLSGEPIRALAVLVVATPCPLILAAPIALIAGVSRAAKRGIIMKGGTALEALSQAKVLLFDKTGTLTQGHPVVSEIEVHGPYNEDELTYLAASLDQASPHVLAGAIVKAALDRKAKLVFPFEAIEVPAKGIRGTVDGHLVAVGRADWVTDAPPPDWIRKVRRRSSADGSANVFVAVDGELSGAFILEDPIRLDSSRTIRNLKRAGIQRTVMVTGDHPDVAETVASAVGVDHVLAQRSPEEKVAAVKAERAWGPTIMVGDGLNDAPALAAADVGVAMGARGATASSEAADVVVVVDRLERLTEAIQIARRARGIALQSVIVGMSLSLTAMVLAAFGLLVPVAGALLQEVIDVAVILNALRALGGYRPSATSDSSQGQVAQRFRQEHSDLAPMLKRLRSVADTLDSLGPEAAMVALAEVNSFLVERLWPHELAEETELYPSMAKMLGGDDPTGPMSRSHVEISHLIRVLGQQLEDCSPAGPQPEDLPDLRRLLYSLDAVLRLHFAQEDEAYLSRTEP